MRMRVPAVAADVDHRARQTLEWREKIPRRHPPFHAVEPNRINSPCDDFEAHERVRPGLGGGKVQGIEVARVENLADQKKRPLPSSLNTITPFRYATWLAGFQSGSVIGAKVLPARQVEQIALLPIHSHDMLPVISKIDDARGGDEVAAGQAGLFGNNS